jgi:hypothetical protein
MRLQRFHVWCAGLLACSLTPSSSLAQLVTNFEPAAYTGSAGGTLLTGQQGWYNPVAGSVDYNVFTYAGNTLGLPVNSTGGTQFVGGASGGGTALARGQHDVDFSFGAASIWTLSYDFAHRYNGTLPSAQNLGSFSLAHTGTTTFRQLIALHAWVDVNTATNFNAGFNVYDAAGVAQPTQSPGAAWNNLLVDNWYRESFTVDFSTNTVLSVSLTDLTGGGGTNTFNPTGWFMLGGSAGTANPLPTSVRFFAGGALGNVAGWDNLDIQPIPEPTSIALLGAGFLGVIARRWRSRRS